MKVAPINIVATGSANILKKAIKGDILPQSEGSLHEDLAFKYRIYRPETPNGDTMVLLHGSGQDETSLVSFGFKIAPNAVLLAVRGRVVQDGSNRWYRRLTPISFDQKDIRSEAKAFAEFLKQVTREYKIDPNRTTFLGYSNGANLVNAVMMLYPDLVKQAVLLRSMPVLTGTLRLILPMPACLTVSGASDQLYAPYAPALEDMLRSHGARVEARSIKSDHGLGKDDVKVVSEWLSGVQRLSSIRTKRLTPILLHQARQSFICLTMKTRPTHQSFVQSAFAGLTNRAFLLPLLLDLIGDRRAR